jgi:transposase
MPTQAKLTLYETRKKELLRFIADQRAITVGQFIRFSGLEQEQAAHVLKIFEEEEWLEIKPVFTGQDDWMWLKSSGHTYAETGFKTTDVSYRSFRHWSAITESRLWIEKHQEVHQWFSERKLRRMQRGRPKGYLPDAIAVVAFVNKEGIKKRYRIAVEAELSVKASEEIEDRLTAFESVYGGIAYFTTPDVYRRFTKLELKKKHPKLSVRVTATMDNSLAQRAWRVPGDPSRPAKIVSASLPKCEIEVLKFLSEQGCASMDQLERVIGGSSPEGAETLVSRFVQEGLMRRARPLVDDRIWTWMTPRGARMSGTGLIAETPSLGSLERTRAINEVRLSIPKELTDVRWESERALRQKQGPKGSLPDAIVHIGKERRAIEVMLFAPDPLPLKKRAMERLEKYDTVAWFYTQRTRRPLLTVAAELRSSKFRVEPIPGLQMPTLQKRASAKRAGSRRPARRGSSVRRARQSRNDNPAVIVVRYMSEEEIPAKALQAFFEMPGIDREARVVSAWRRRGMGSQPIYLATTAGVYRLVSGRGGNWQGKKADLKGRFIKINPAELARKRMESDQPHEVDDALWAELEPFIPKRSTVGKGRKWMASDRDALEAMLFVLRNGLTVADLPKELGYGSPASTRARLRAWEESKGWPHFLEVLTEKLPDGSRLNWPRMGPQLGDRAEAVAAAVRRRTESDQPYEIDDVLWAELEPFIPRPPQSVRRGGAKRRISERDVVSGMLFILRTGIAWTRLPAELNYGSGSGIYTYLRRWEGYEGWPRFIEALEEKLPDGKQLDFSRLTPRRFRKGA